MLEILLVWSLAKKVGEIVEKKGHASGLYKLLLVGLWIAGEIAGFIVGAVVAAGMAAGGEEPSFIIIYVFALIGAASGAAIAFVLANNLTPVERNYDDGLDRFARREPRRSWEEDEPVGRHSREADDRISRGPDNRYTK